MKLNWSVWLYGLISGFIGGGASAVTSAIVMPNIDPQDFNFSTGMHKMLITMVSFFVVHGVLVAMAYLAKSPLPAQELKT